MKSEHPRTHPSSANEPESTPSTTVPSPMTRRNFSTGALAAGVLLANGTPGTILAATQTEATTPSKLKYPPTRQVNAVDGQAGVVFADPYRWLEENTPEVRSWQEAQAELASIYVRQWPHFEALQRSIDRFAVEVRGGFVLRFAAGHWFWMQDGNILTGATPLTGGRVVFDPKSEKSTRPDTPAVVLWMSPSPNGQLLAVGVCTDGSEHNTIRLVKVASGALLPNSPPQQLMDSWTGGAGWHPDSHGFFFEALDGPAQSFNRQLFFHDVGAGTQTVVALPGVDPKDRDYTIVTASTDGRYLLAHHRLSTPIPVAFKDLSTPDSPWHPFVTEVDGMLLGHVIGDRFVGFTDVNARRGRIVALALNSPTPNDPKTWTELVPESAAVIRSTYAISTHLYIAELVDTYARIRVLDREGRLQEMPLPGKGVVQELPFPLMSLIPRGHPQAFVFTYSSLATSAAVYSHRPSAKSLTVLRPPEAILQDVVIEEFWVASADGTRVPYHTIRLKSVDVEKPQPTLINAYGGFNISWLPGFPGPMASFVAAGGVFVNANIRGGGEFGKDWWEGGRLKHKQNCYADLYAVAEDLIHSDRTRADLLAVTGGSNGGLMAGVALTQRPELWTAVIPQSPLLDVIGAMRDPYARHFLTLEYGNPDDPDEVRRMAGFSPYQLVKDGTKYPAVYIDAGDTDPRCAPWHARKLAARLQAASAGDAPLLLHVWKNAGHGGWATDKSIQNQREAAWLAFCMMQLGMKL